MGITVLLFLLALFSNQVKCLDKADLTLNEGHVREQFELFRREATQTPAAPIAPLKVEYTEWNSEITAFNTRLQAYQKLLERDKLQGKDFICKCKIIGCNVEVILLRFLHDALNLMIGMEAMMDGDDLQAQAQYIRNILKRLWGMLWSASECLNELSRKKNSSMINLSQKSVDLAVFLDTFCEETAMEHFVRVVALIRLFHQSINPFITKEDTV